MSLRSRIFIRTSLILGAIVLTAFMWASGSILISLKEHFLHGPHIRIRQSSVDLPALWRVDNGPHRAQGLHLGRATFGTYETQRLIIDYELDGSSPGAEEWQRATLARHPGSSSGAHYEGEVMPTKYYVFYCVKRDDAETSQVDFTCKAGTEKWSFDYYGGQEYLDEVRGIVGSLR
jgi:hypothetical protein